MSHDLNINDLKEKLRKKRTAGSSSLKARLSGGADSSEENEKREDTEKETETPESDEEDTLTREEAPDGGDDETKEEDEQQEETADDGVDIIHHHDYDPEDDDGYPDDTPPNNARKFQMPRLEFKLTRARLMGAGGLLIFSVLAVLVWYVVSDVSDVKAINIEGNSVISEDEIAERLSFEEGDKMFALGTGQSEEDIALLPVIVDVTVERDWWNSVNVTVDEYQTVGYMENEGEYNPVLENSRVLRGYTAMPSTGPILHYFEGEEFERVVDGLTQLDHSILEAMSEIYYRPSDNSQTRIHIFMNDGQEIVADYRDFGEKMSHYVGMKEEIGDDTEGIIDIEIGSSFLPYDSDEAEEVKRGIYNEPVQADYIGDINDSLNSVKEQLNTMGEDADQAREREELEQEADREESEG